MNRKTLKDFTFSDGTVVPAGYTVAVALAATHLDDVSAQVKTRNKWADTDSRQIIQMPTSSMVFDLHR
jgi:hypothetical protein